METIDDSLELRVYYGTTGCVYIKRIDENQTDSSYTINIIKCDNRKNDPDITCPSEFVEDSLIRKIDIPIRDTFEFVINDSLVKWVRER